jgi:hypothetical protein
MSEEQVTTIVDDYPHEQARLRELIKVYESLGLVGPFNKCIIEAALREADAAMASGDIVRIVLAYQSMKGCK